MRFANWVNLLRFIGARTMFSSKSRNISLSLTKAKAYPDSQIPFNKTGLVKTDSEAKSIFTVSEVPAFMLLNQLYKFQSLHNSFHVHLNLHQFQRNSDCGTPQRGACTEKPSSWRESPDGLQKEGALTRPISWGEGQTSQNLGASPKSLANRVRGSPDIKRWPLSKRAV